MLCPSCSHVVPDHARYCSACGRPIVSAQSPTFTSPGYAGQRAVVTHQPRTAGTILAERYRIVGLLGRGGMGEVYRADDLKLGQAVALKFLPPETRGDPAALERFRNEVRVARQVSHPNVCRIYDLSDGDGEPFLSMEYVDGEDLASLLRRIGRLPPDKAVQVARQLCAGLSAAHDLGVLHRDLKPANVMLDGRGVAKITDFGLADFAERIAPHEIAGTPGYMAPEQLTGAPASTRTDLYSLGLVLFEMFTGAPAFVPGSPEDRRRASRDSSPPTPAATQPAIDPAVDRVIVRCLDPDPAKRPPSARAVAAALPGGDPLAAALAAGETPSPEMVAQAGGVGSLQPWVAWSLFATIVACLIAIGLMSDRARLTRMLGVNQSPEVLRARAKAILARVGHTETPLDTIHGFEFDVDYAAYLVRENSAAAWNNARKGRPALIRFWYRQGPSWMTPWTVAQRPTLGDPPAVDPGSAAVLLDPQGRLIRLAVLPTAGETQGPPTGVDWAPVFDEAGLRLSDFTPAPPARIPPLYADSRAAWTGRFADNPSIDVRIEAAALGGRPVYFDIVNPWPAASARAIIGRSGILVLSSLILVLIFVAALLARRNTRLARSDYRSAFRIGLFTFLLAIPLFLFGTHHVGGIDELWQLLKAASTQLAFAAVFWLGYVALEPFVRRRWPNLIVSSTRLLSGRVTDPLIGRDVLIGAASGILSSTALWTTQTVAAAREQSLLLQPSFVLGPLGNPSETIALLAQTVTSAIQDALGVMMLLLVLTVALRKRWLVIVSFFGLLAVVMSVGLLGAVALVPLFAAAVATLIVVRFGILAAAANTLFYGMTAWFPLTLDLNAFYLPASLLAGTVLLALSWFALYTSLGGRPLAGWMESDT